MNKYEALHSFWSSFDWKAYNENSVPTDALAKNNNRYITYESASDSWDEIMVLTASLWHKSTSWVTVHAKASEIAEWIVKQYPPAIPIDGGYLRIRKGSPFAVDMGDEDSTLRRTRINIIVEFMTAY